MTEKSTDTASDRSSVARTERSAGLEAADFETIEVDSRDRVATIELNRPDRRNAISPRMASEISAALDLLENESQVRAIRLRGRGANFCSGGDLAPDPSQLDADRPQGSAAAVTLDVMNRVYGKMIRTLHGFPKPVVAEVRGIAAGAGANLAFACDFVYATPDARFSEIFVRRGLGLDCGGSWLLPRLVGLQRAKELAFFGDWVEAPRALEMGLVTEIFEDGLLSESVEARLATLASRPPIALAQIKQSLHRATSLSMAEALEIEAVAQAACSATEDMAEGVRAFIEKREPRFEGR